MLNTYSLYIYAILVLIIVLIGLKSQSYSKYFGNKIFKALVLVTIIMLITDFAHENLNGINTNINKIFYPILSVIIYIVPFILGLIWSVYVYLLIYLKKPKLNFIEYIYLFPALLGIILSILSAFYPIFFLFSNQNTYIRGPMYPLSLILQYFYLIFPTIMLIINRKKIHSYKFYPLVLFVIPPMIGGIIQALIYGILIIWPLLALSILMVFVFVQSQLIKTDYLTGLMNKRAFENHINKIVISKKTEKLSAIYMDLDNFKKINDQYGHSIGDEVLRIFARKCQETFYNASFLARIGGDEFVVLLYIDDIKELQKSINELKNKLEIINKTRQFDFDISFSYGSNIYNKKSFTSINDFLNQSDKLMYNNKNNKRA
ncbi:MAG: GGDEF domain-containing protein [Bacillota bacterium]